MKIRYLLPVIGCFLLVVGCGSSKSPGADTPPESPQEVPEGEEGTESNAPPPIQTEETSIPSQPQGEIVEMVRVTGDEAQISLVSAERCETTLTKLHKCKWPTWKFETPSALSNAPVRTKLEYVVSGSCSMTHLLILAVEASEVEPKRFHLIDRTLRISRQDRQPINELKLSDQNGGSQRIFVDKDCDIKLKVKFNEPDLDDAPPLTTIDPATLKVVEGVPRNPVNLDLVSEQNCQRIVRDKPYLANCVWPTWKFVGMNSVEEPFKSVHFTPVFTGDCTTQYMLDLQIETPNEWPSVLHIYRGNSVTIQRRDGKPIEEITIFDVTKAMKYYKVDTTCRVQVEMLRQQ